MPLTVGSSTVIGDQAGPSTAPEWLELRKAQAVRQLAASFWIAGA